MGGLAGRIKYLHEEPSLTFKEMNLLNKTSPGMDKPQNVQNVQSGAPPGISSLFPKTATTLSQIAGGNLPQGIL